MLWPGAYVIVTRYPIHSLRLSESAQTPLHRRPLAESGNARHQEIIQLSRPPVGLRSPAGRTRWNRVPFVEPCFANLLRREGHTAMPCMPRLTATAPFLTLPTTRSRWWLHDITRRRLGRSRRVLLQPGDLRLQPSYFRLQLGNPSQERRCRLSDDRANFIFREKTSHTSFIIHVLPSTNISFY